MKVKIIAILAVVLTGLLFTSCDDKIEVQQAYDFSLTTMPVQKRIKPGETAEIRLQLHKSGNYKKNGVLHFLLPTRRTWEPADGRRDCVCSQ